MNKYEMEEVRVRLKAARTKDQKRHVIDSYAELLDRPVSEVQAMCDCNTDVLQGRPIGTTRKRRLSNARRFGWGENENFDSQDR